MARNYWTEEEYIITMYLYRFGYEGLGHSYNEIGRILGRTPDSIIMRFANYLSCENSETGLNGGGKKAAEMYEKYIGIPENDLRRMSLKALVELNHQR